VDSRDSLGSVTSLLLHEDRVDFESTVLWFFKRLMTEIVSDLEHLLSVRPENSAHDVYLVSRIREVPLVVS